MLVSSSAIVLSKVRYQDNDLIIKCLTRDLGVVSYMVKNISVSKKSKNKLINTLINDTFEVKGKTTFKEELAQHGVIFCSISEAVQEYPELIGNIDLEVASNEQLLAIMNLVNKTRVERLALAKGAARIDKLADEAAEDELELREDILDIEINLAKTSATNSAQYVAFYEEQIEKIEDKIELIQKEFRLEEQKELKLLDRFRNLQAKS